MKSAVTVDCLNRWKHRWEKGEKGAHSRVLQPRLSGKTLRLHKGMKKHQSAITVQLRTGKIGLRAFLYKMKVPDIDSPLCPTCGELETVQHVLLRCQRWTELREECLRDGLKTGVRPSLQALLHTKQGCQAAARMIQRTELLTQYRLCETFEVETREEREEREEEEREGEPVRA